MRDRAFIALAIVTALSLFIGCSGFICAWHWKQTADKYAYALSD